MQFSSNDGLVELYAEIILHDVLDHIFSFLSIYDLNQAASVCKSWRNAAQIERSRRGPQVMLLQALEDFVATKFSNLSPAHRNEAIDDYKLCLRIKPRIGIFFTDGKYPASADCDNVPYEICKTHRWTRPVDCFYVAIEALAVNKNEDAIGGERNITAAVFLPELPAVNYAIAETSSHSIEQYFRSGGSLLTDIADKLFAKEADHTCFFIFLYQWQDEPTYENHHSNFLNMVLDGIKAAKDENLPYQSTSFCAMGISGSSMMSWSIVIDHRMQQFEIEEKLQSFKINIHLQSSSIAFLILPTLRDNIDRSRLDIFKNIFPTITLMSIFNDKNNAVLSLDSMNFECNPELKQFNSYAYVILTYKK